MTLCVFSGLLIRHLWLVSSATLKYVFSTESLKERGGEGENIAVPSIGERSELCALIHFTGIH